MRKPRIVRLCWSKDPRSPDSKEVLGFRNSQSHCKFRRSLAIHQGPDPEGPASPANELDLLQTLEWPTSRHRAWRSPPALDRHPRQEDPIRSTATTVACC